MGHRRSLRVAQTFMSQPKGFMELGLATHTPDLARTLTDWLAGSILNHTCPRPHSSLDWSTLDRFRGTCTVRTVYTHRKFYPFLILFFTFPFIFALSSYHFFFYLPSCYFLFPILSSSFSTFPSPSIILYLYYSIISSFYPSSCYALSLKFCHLLFISFFTGMLFFSYILHFTLSVLSLF